MIIEQVLLEQEHALWMASRQMNAFAPPEQLTRDEKLAAALAFLGERWVLHPVNYVRRIPIFLGAVDA